MPDKGRDMKAKKTIQRISGKKGHHDIACIDLEEWDALFDRVGLGGNPVDILGNCDLSYVVFVI